MSFIVRYSERKLVVAAHPAPSLERICGGSREWMPAVDIYETDEALVIVVELAGVSHKDIKVSVEGRRLRIEGWRQPTCAVRGARFHCLEIPSGHFERNLLVPFAFAPNAVEASTSEGLLTITIRKGK